MGFGDFESLCAKAALPVCSLIGPASKITGATGIPSQCYSRSVGLANTIIFQGAADFAHIMALIMTAIMIIHVRSKFTAVGAFLLVFSRIPNTHCVLQVEKRSPPSSTSTWV